MKESPSFASLVMAPAGLSRTNDDVVMLSAPWLLLFATIAVPSANASLNVRFGKLATGVTVSLPSGAAFTVVVDFLPPEAALFLPPELPPQLANSPSSTTAAAQRPHVFTVVPRIHAARDRPKP